MNATATQIKNRREAKDVFITPADLAKKHIDIVKNILIGLHNLTAKRIEFMEHYGYKIVNIHLCKVFKWFGMSAIVTWERSNNKKGIIDYDRIVWRE